MINPKDVIARYSVDELCETAEEYFRRIPDPTPLMAKPFAFLHETPEMLQNLGLLLSGLRLGRTMSVLDFGAGTGWLSRFLAQLNCQPIACDASITALNIGRRLLEELPLVGTAVYKPKWLHFDGHALNLPSESVDRIICFDAFHHIPNTEEVLLEMGRVLRKGGIAGFSEPGRRHSQSPQSQYEMSHHRVLENDIDLNHIFEQGKPAGFTSLTVKVVTDKELSLDEYNRIYDERDKTSLAAELWNQTHNTMFNRSIFFLHKGPFQPDSRGHVGLAHDLSIERASPVVTRGTPVSVTLRIRNRGSAVWLHQNSEIFGIVRVGTHLFKGDGTLISIDHSRHDLPESVEPGDELRLNVEVPLPEPGTYRVVFDLVAEGVLWFENAGSVPVEAEITVL